MTPRRTHGPDRTGPPQAPASQGVQLHLFEDVSDATRPARTYAPVHAPRYGRPVVDVPVGRYL
jgi:hypothetical protein